MIDSVSDRDEKEISSRNLFQIAREKLCDYVLITYMKKYELAYHYYAEAKRASSAKIIYSNPASDIVRSVQTTAYDQKIYIYVLFTSQGLSVLGKTVPEVLDTQNRVRILKGDLKGFQEKFKTKDRIPSAVSGQYGENTARSRNQSDWRICRIPPAHELRKKLKMIFSHLKGAKKKENQSLAKTFKELFSLCPNHFR